MPAGKVFGIGLSRTGTSSLDAALAVLGLRTIHFPSDPLTRGEIAGHLAAGGPLRLSVLESVDAISDTPVCCVYQGLDAAYPGSRFVLTIREEAEWLRSCEAYWRKPRGSRRTGLRVALRRARGATGGDGLDFSAYVRLVNRHLYGTELFDPAQFSAVRRRYEDEVARHFQGREDQLLRLDICSGQGWPELCDFLDVERPATPFPWANRLAS